MPTTYYVRKTGSDGAAGTSAGAAWLTIGKALLAGGMASGDTVYIGAGIYREAILIGFTPAATTSVIGDVDGSKTGDAGEVRWTAYTTTDKAVPSVNATCRLNGKSFLSFSNLHFVGGASASGTCIDAQTATGSHDITFTKCAFTPGSNLGVRLIGHTVIVDVAASWTYDSCWFGPTGGGSTQQIVIGIPTSTVADYDIALTIKNCVFLGSDSLGGVSALGTGANSFKGGGLKVYNCTLMDSNLQCNTVSTVYPMLVSNCLVWLGEALTKAFATAANGQLVEDYNLTWGAARTLFQVSIGPFTTDAGTVYSSSLLSFGQEMIWGGQARPFLTPLAGSPALGFGNAALAVGRAPTVTDDATTGTIAWTNPGNAAAIDASLATCVLTLNATGHYLNAQGFNLAVPGTATIKSVRVEALVKSAAGSVTKCASVKLIKGGAIAGNDLATSNASFFGTALTCQSWGTTADPLWGNTLTPTDVNAANFGCAWAATTTTAETCSVDMIRIIVAYTLADGSGGVAVDILGGPRPAGGLSTAYAVGAYERGNTATVQPTTVHTAGGNAWQIAGPGYQDFRTNVDAASTSLGVWARYDTAAQQPIATVLAAPELGLLTDTVLTWSDPGTNTWGQFSTTLVPTAAGIIILRLQTAVGTGNAFFDDVTLVA